MYETPTCVADTMFPHINVFNEARIRVWLKLFPSPTDFTTWVEPAVGHSWDYYRITPSLGNCSNIKHAKEDICVSSPTALWVPLAHLQVAISVLSWSLLFSCYKTLICKRSGRFQCYYKAFGIIPSTKVNIRKSCFFRHIFYLIFFWLLSTDLSRQHHHHHYPPPLKPPHHNLPPNTPCHCLILLLYFTSHFTSHYLRFVELLEWKQTKLYCGGQGKTYRSYLSEILYSLSYGPPKYCSL